MTKYIIFSALLLTGCAVCSGCGAGPGKSPSTPPSTPSNPIYVNAVNNSPMSGARFSQMVSDINIQLSRDFGPNMGIYAVLSDHQSSWEVLIQASGFKFPADFSYSSGTICYDNYQKANSVDPSGNQDSLDCSHELLQELVMLSSIGNPSVGVCDCTAGNSYSVINSSIGNPGIGNQTVSDFAFPAFFDTSIKPNYINGKPVYDFCQKLTSPLTPLPGGSLLYLAKW